MSLSTRISVIGQSVEALIDEALSPEAQSRYLAEAARDALAEGKATNRAALGREPPFESFVDGRATDDLDSVRPTGRISFEFQLFGEVLDWIGEQLVTHSPVLSGEYARSHLLFADGIDRTGANVTDGGEFVFVNSVPYARKIERGQSPQAPDGVYEAVAAVAAGRFGNIAKITFTYRAVLGMRVVNQDLAASSGASWWLGHSGNARAASGVVESQVGKQFGQLAHNQANVRFPAISVRF